MVDRGPGSQRLEGAGGSGTTGHFPMRGATRPKTAATRSRVASSTPHSQQQHHNSNAPPGPTLTIEDVDGSAPLSSTAAHQGAHRPTPSSAVVKMKALTAQKEKEVLRYMQKFTVAPYASRSAKSARRSSVGSVAAVYTANSLHMQILRPKSAHPADGASRGVSPRARTADPFSPRGGYNHTTLIASPLSAKLMASARDAGASAAEASALGRAIDTLDSPSLQPPPTSSSLDYAVPATTSSAFPQDQLLLVPANHTGFPPNYSNPNGAYNSVHAGRPFSSQRQEQQRRTSGLDSAATDGGGDGGGRWLTPHATHGRRGSSSAIAGIVTGPVEEEEGKPIKSNPRKQFQVSDLSLMDKHLCTLTDAECPIDQLLAALNSLTLILQENESVAPVLMFDRGAVTIILNLMNTFPTSAEIAVKSAVILEYMAQRNHLTLSSIHKQNGILTLLSAIQVAFKGGQQATAEALTMAGPSRTSSKRGKKNGPIAGSRSNSRNNLVRAPSMGSNTSLASVNILNEESPRGSHSQTSVPSGFSTLPVGSYRTVDANSEVEQGESLMEGLLQKYFDPRFKSQMEKMDKTTRAEIIKHLLTLFEKIDRLLSVSGLISLDIDLDEAIDQIVGEAGQMLQSELILLYLVDPESGELIATEYDPFVDAKEREMIERLRFPAGTGIVGWVAETEDFVNVKDASNHDRFNPVIDTRCEGEVLEANSILCVPIKNRDGVLKGVLQAVNKIGANGSIQPFNHEDEFLLRTLGRQSGLIIQNGQIYAQTKRTQKKVDILLETTRSLGSTLQLDVLVKMIMEAAKELLAADRCTIFLADEKKKYLTTHIQGRDFVQEIRIPINTGIAGYVFSSGNSVNIHDAYKDSRFNPEVDRQTGYVTRNILCVPIKNKNGESIGVTQMINRKSGSFDADDEKMLISFSAQAAVTIEKTYLFKKLEDTLRETSQMKNYLFMILQSITNVVITLDGDGCLSHINHPSKMDMEPMLQQMKSSHYKEWLGDENATLVADIQRAYTTAGGTIFAQDYELHIQGKIRNVNYTIVQMTSETQLSRDKHNAGVVIVLEDISSEKRAMMTLGRYMSPALAKQVMAEDGGQLGGKRKKVAILFSDIRSFTTLSESMEPHEVVELLNHHFSDAVNAIMSEQGILDKYIGDAVMAVFGVPFVSPDDSIHACNAALRMKESLVIFNEARAKAGLIQIKIGIGVNTGMVLSGNIGSTKRMEFSCIGDAVNLASRIEGLTKYYNMTILVSEFTLQETGNHFVTREVDQVVVTGKSKQVGIYELLGRVDDPIPDTVMQGVELYRQGLALYRQRKFSEAIEVFTRAINEVDDGPSKTMRTRCKKYIEDPPAPGWNGVYISDSK